MLELSIHNLPKHLTIDHIKEANQLAFGVNSKFKHLGLVKFKTVYTEYLATTDVRKFFSKHKIASTKFTKHLPKIFITIKEGCPNCGLAIYQKSIATRSELKHGELASNYECVGCNSSLYPDGSHASCKCIPCVSKRELEIKAHEEQIKLRRYVSKEVSISSTDSVEPSYQNMTLVEQNQQLRRENTRKEQVIEFFEAMAFDLLPPDKQSYLTALINGSITVEKAQSLLEIKGW